jgi:mannonate dehydratase
MKKALCQKTCFPTTCYSPGAPYVENGYMHINEAPGLGVDVNEELAAKYPIPDVQMNNWTQLRRNDGTIVRP